jgi:hypothetical protein
VSQPPDRPRLFVQLLLVVPAFGVLLAAGARAGEVPNAVLVLETVPGTPGSVPEGAPPRFALLKDGQAFVGSTSRVETVQLEKREAQALRRLADAARKAIGHERSVALGRGGRRVVLRFEDEPPVEVSLGEDTAIAAGSEPVRTLVRELLAFLHQGLVPYAPVSYAMRLREGTLVGGCRRWNFAFPLVQALGGPRAVSAEEAEGWPKGALPASVCGADGKHYVLTLRPLLPGEQP